MNALNYFLRDPEKSESFGPAASKPDEGPEKCADCGKELSWVAMAGLVSNCCEACHARRLEPFSGLSDKAVAEIKSGLEKNWHRSRWVRMAAVVAVLAAACIFAASGVKRRHARWSAARHVRQAAEFF